MNLPKIKSLSELYWKANTDKRYERLAIVAAQNLGGFIHNFQQAKTWLDTNALETDEKGIVDEINFCRDIVLKEEAKA